jgi:hypothetical protein
VRCAVEIAVRQFGNPIVALQLTTSTQPESRPTPLRRLSCRRRAPRRSQ